MKLSFVKVVITLLAAREASAGFILEKSGYTRIEENSVAPKSAFRNAARIFGGACIGAGLTFVLVSFTGTGDEVGGEDLEGLLPNEIKTQVI